MEGGAACHPVVRLRQRLRSLRLRVQDRRRRLHRGHLRSVFRESHCGPAGGSASEGGRGSSDRNRGEGALWRL